MFTIHSFKPEIIMKKSLIPKIQRAKPALVFEIREMIEGLPLAIFKHNDIIYFATGQYIFSCEQVKNGNSQYIGLLSFATKIETAMQKNLLPNRILLGTWSSTHKKLFITGTATINKNFDLKDICYKTSSVPFVFYDHIIPSEYMELTPLVSHIEAVNPVMMSCLLKSYEQDCGHEVAGLYILDANYRIRYYKPEKEA